MRALSFYARTHLWNPYAHTQKTTVKQYLPSLTFVIFFTFEANFDKLCLALCQHSIFPRVLCFHLETKSPPQPNINDSCTYMKRKFLQAMKRGWARSAPPVTSSRGQEQFRNCRRGVLKTWNDCRGRQIPLCPVEKLTAPCLCCSSFQISVSLNISLAFPALRYIDKDRLRL